MGPVVGPSTAATARTLYERRRAATTALDGHRQGERGAAVALGNVSLRTARPRCSAVGAATCEERTRLRSGQPARQRALTLPASTSGSPRSAVYFKSKERPTSKFKTHSPVAPSLLRAGRTDRRRAAPPPSLLPPSPRPRPPPARQPPAGHLASHLPSNLRPLCAEWCRRASTSATPRLLASPAQKSASASRSIGFWRDFLARAAAGLLYARRRGQDEWDVGFADRINSALCSPHLALAAHPSSTPLTRLEPHPSSPLTQLPGSKYGLHPSTLTPQPFHQVSTLSSPLKLLPRRPSPFSPRAISLGCRIRDQLRQHPTSTPPATENRPPPHDYLWYTEASARVRAPGDSLLSAPSAPPERVRWRGLFLR